MNKIQAHLTIAETALSTILATYSGPFPLGEPVAAVIKGSWAWIICRTEEGTLEVDDWNLIVEAKGGTDMDHLGSVATMAEALALVDFDSEAVTEQLGDQMGLPRIVLQLAA